MAGYLMGGGWFASEREAAAHLNKAMDNWGFGAGTSNAYSKPGSANAARDDIAPLLDALAKVEANSDLWLTWLSHVRQLHKDHLIDCPVHYSTRMAIFALIDAFLDRANHRSEGKSSLCATPFWARSHEYELECNGRAA
jgi:hypothetical protein